MTGGNDIYQLVFLVDLSTGIPEGEDDSKSERVLSSIRVSCLKLLTYFASKHNNRGFKEDFKLRWGFKFYNSVSLTLQVEKYNFHEFTLNSYQEFEKELEKRFECERLKSHGLVKVEGHSVNDHKVEGPVRDDADAVDNLQKCLKELLHDFQWDRPDVTSPTRFSQPLRGRGKLRKSLTYSEPHLCNFVFLFSPCPHSLNDVNQFISSDHPTSSESHVLGSFMPSTLQRHFYEQFKIGMYWVDVGADPLALVNQNKVMIWRSTQIMTYSAKVCN